MIYADYGYYSTTGQGKVKEEKFNRLAIKASRIVDYYTFNRIKEADDNVKLATCELVDYLEQREEEEGKDIASEKVGTYSVTYSEKFSQSDSQKQKQIIRRYLGHTNLMYRGV